MPQLILQHVTLYNNNEPVDCGMTDGVITALGHITPQPNDRVVDATGLTVLPGVMDMHVHFRVPGETEKEDWTTGVTAALAGGVTTVLDMPNNKPAITSKKLLEEKFQLINETHPVIGYGLYIGATTENLEDLIASQSMACGIKIAPYFTGKGGRVLIDDIPALKKMFAANLRVPIVIHCEDETTITQNRSAQSNPTPADHNRIRSPQSAMTALTHILLAARGTRAKLHITHVSTKREVIAIRDAKQQGIDITCDTTPHHITFTETDVVPNDGRMKVNPPFRSKEDRDAVWNAVLDGTIDMIGSDHAPHTLKEKEQSNYDAIPSGVPGVQTLLPVLLNRLSHRFSLHDIVRLTSTAPRKRFQQPAVDIAVGRPADMVLVDLTQDTMLTAETLKSKCGWSPWEHVPLHGKVAMTICHGSIVSRS